jgi:hypothetical protein
MEKHVNRDARIIATIMEFVTLYKIFAHVFKDMEELIVVYIVMIFANCIMVINK